MTENGTRPKSCVSWFDPFLIGIVITGVSALFFGENISASAFFLTLVGAVTFVMVPIEYIRSPARNVPRPADALNDILKRSVLKWMGTMAGLSLMLLLWVFVPEYSKPRYIPLFQTGNMILPYVPFVLALVIFVTEWRLGPDRDYAWQFGQLCLGRFADIDWTLVRAGLFAWLVRLFFLPLNLVDAVRGIGLFQKHPPVLSSLDWPGWVSLLTQLTYVALLIAIVPGYAFASRLLGTAIKKVDQTAFGWFVTLLCYAPLYIGARSAWFQYTGGAKTQPWIAQFGDTGTASLIAGGILIFCAFVHYWAEAICCLRSAHLSSRGIITNGPFALTKHPTYVIKCVAWVVASLPFLSGASVMLNVSQTLAFCALCFVFILRSWIEERLLSTDATYVAYARWVDEHGVFRVLGRIIPVFSYNWRYNHWKNAGLV